MAVILQFRSPVVADEGEQPESALSQLSDLEQLLHYMRAVDGALSAIKYYLMEEASRCATAGKLDLAEQT